MTRWLRGKQGGVLAFLVVAGLVLSGLGWLTVAAVRLEGEGLLAQAQARQVEKMRLALWRLDSLLSPVFAREDSRPFQDYADVYAPVAILQPDGSPMPPGQVLELSPLVSEELPPWLSLHFQVGASGAWSSPQVIPEALAWRISQSLPLVKMINRTPERREELQRLSQQMQAKALVDYVQAQSGLVTRQNLTLLANTNEMNTSPNSSQFAQQAVPNAQYDLNLRNQSMQQNPANNMGMRKEVPQARRSVPAFLNDASKQMFQSARAMTPQVPEGHVVSVTLGPMTSFWKTGPDGEQQLFLMRPAKYEGKEFCQGALLDWKSLQEILRHEVEDLFPQLDFRQISHAQPPESEPTLATIPVMLEPGAEPVQSVQSSWSALRFGLILAWTAALVALSAVALGGWTLIDLSERRFRFVSAVTHELRTPLTTLRLYLDMLAGGMIKDEAQRGEYLQTLNNEADRLNRLVGNVLDFSRLENQRPRLVRERIVLRELLSEVSQAWIGRCHDAGMELVIEPSDLLTQSVTTDVRLVQQILGNLIDNACKYCVEAVERQIRLRTCQASSDRLAIEVEDYGPGIPLLERRSIFRAFQRGKRSEFITGGVGLGLALAERWAKLLGGTLTLKPTQGMGGACFRLEIPFDS
jgi:signal transduction histidine kinase